MKTISILILFSLCVYSGFTFSLGLRKRKKELANLCDAFEELLRCIKYKPKSCKEAIVEVAKSTSDPVFVFLSEVDGNDPSALAENRLKDKMYLSETDWSILNKYFISFGKRHTDEEVESCVRTIDALRQQYDVSNETVKKYADLWMKSGILAGVFVVIMLM